VVFVDERVREGIEGDCWRGLRGLMGRSDRKMS
jgi:hypothetical protein